MSGQPSTIRTSNKETVDDPSAVNRSSVARDRIVQFWREQVDANVLRTCEAFPSLEKNRSLLLDLAVEEFKLKENHLGLSAQEYCGQFRKLGVSLEQSIFRAIEVQDYLDTHPELLEFVVNFQWPLPGDSLQGFSVVEELGRGAIARVYLCQETGLGGREVVVKVARGNGYEAELMARLDHPNIVPVYSVANDDDRFVSYICMPFRGRNTLEQLVGIAARRIPENATDLLTAAGGDDGVKLDAKIRGLDRNLRGSCVDGIIRIAIKLADALRHAHSAGVLHGDLKPSNVLLTSAVEPLLIDFNLARDQRSESTPCGGTLAYMPPETLRALSDGDLAANTYDVRSEVYSFGALLFELLSGEVPFPLGSEGDTSAIALQLVKLQSLHIPSIRLRNRTVNRGLEQLVLECLAVDPNSRPKSFEEIQNRLRKQAALPFRVVRNSAARPYLTGVGLGATAASALALSAFLLLRPSYAARQLTLGVALSNRGEYSAAANAFTNALAEEEQLRDALCLRALANLQNGKPADASHDFYRLYTTFNDVRCAAFVGYCFNLRNQHAAAIMWYEKALAEGFETPAVHSNLGISYAICQSHVGHLERFDFASRHLNRALEIDGAFVPARLNSMELAIILGGRLPENEIESVAENAEYLLSKLPGDKLVLHFACRVFGLLSSKDPVYVDRCAEVFSMAAAAKCGPSRDELIGRSVYARLRQHASYNDILSNVLKSPWRDSRGPTFAPPANVKLESFGNPVSLSASTM